MGLLVSCRRHSIRDHCLLISLHYIMHVVIDIIVN